MDQTEMTQNSVKDYYTKELHSTSDLKTDACKTAKAPKDPKLIQMIKNVPDEVLARYYGCGLIFPSHLTGASVLDLGCGSGRDCYVLSQICGANGDNEVEANSNSESGEVYGVDMTQQQLEVAKRCQETFSKEFPRAAPIHFLLGCLEDLQGAGVPANHFDLIVSNCVINLVNDKRKVLRNALQSLKPFGEMYFSDVYTDRPIPLELQKDVELWGECLSGALQWSELLEICAELNFSPPRILEAESICVQNAQLEQRLSSHTSSPPKFFSVTCRFFKQPPEYKTEKEVKALLRFDSPEPMQFDHFVTFQTNKVYKVGDPILLEFLLNSRYSKYFTRIENAGESDSPQQDIPIRKFDDPSAFLKVEQSGTSKSSSSCCAGSKKCC